MFESSCLRRVANWSTLEKEHKFDKETFDAKKFLEDMPNASPKLNEMLKKIKELDEEDMKYHGKRFKHFIFSEVKAGGYGARVIAGGLIAVGMSLCYDRQLKLKDDDVLMETSGNNFGYLCSTTIYEQTLPINVKKGMLEKFNRRPDNVNGDLIRIMVADGGFKEGIDLFDVKYVHIFEPQTSEADLKQAIGRATRKCGQAGLDFHPSYGWTLNVFIYDVLIPEKLRTDITDAETLFDLYLKNTNVDVRKVNFAKQLEKNAIFGAVDYPLNRNIIDLRGGAKKKPKPPQLGNEVFCDRPCSINRPSKYVPVSLPLFIAVAIAVNAELPDKKLRKPRQHFCKLLQINRTFCKTLQKAFYDQTKFFQKYLSTIVKAIENKVHMKLNSSLRVKFLKFVYAFSSRSVKRRILNAPDVQEAFQSKDASRRFYRRLPKQYGSNGITQNDASEREQEFEYLMSNVPRFNQRMSFKDTRDFIVDNYGVFTWPKVELENLCVKKGGGYEDDANALLKEMEEEIQQEDEEQLAAMNQGVGKSVIAKFTPTQDFIRHYLTPDNPYKGLLLFQSVGTGKTCTAIATATSSFEKEGWTILWVTRTTLKDDIWKNMFDTVCSLTMQEKISKGVKFPQKLTDKMRLLSKGWSIRPMSYKQFTNLVAGNNKSLQDLIKKNGSEDPLRKTLLIIDEAHKLYGGTDLLPAERPDMKKLNAALQHSYKVSGNDSVKLLLMTATPYTNDPMELIKLLNLLQEQNNQLPSTFDEFKQVFLDDETWNFTEEGRDLFLEKINGLISFLDRGNDAREFAQPRVSLVTVPLSLKPIADIMKLKEEHDTDVASLKNVIKQLDESFALFKETKLDQIKDELKSVCGNLKGQAYLDCKNTSTPYIQLLLKSIEDMSGKISQIKETHANEIKRLNAEFNKVKEIAETNISQQHILETKCAAKSMTT